jgi:hypothetical protein
MIPPESSHEQIHYRITPDHGRDPTLPRLQLWTSWPKGRSTPVVTTATLTKSGLRAAPLVDRNRKVRHESEHRQANARTYRPSRRRTAIPRPKALNDTIAAGVAALGPCLDMDETIRELHWVADHRFRSVSLPGYNADKEPAGELTSHNGDYEGRQSAARWGPDHCLCW